MQPPAALLEVLRTSTAVPSAVDVFAARSALSAMFASYGKEAASTLERLKDVKFESDRHNWKAKHVKLRSIIRDHPEDFYIDSHENGLVGITHKTGFRFHMPVQEVPQHLLHRPVGMAPWQTPSTTS